MAIAVSATLVWLLTREGGLSGTALAIIVVGFLIGGGRGPVHRAHREDDRDAAAGVAVQRGWRRRGGTGRHRRLHPPRPTGTAVDTTIFVVLGALIGSITFTGSLIAGGKLQGLIPGKPIFLPGGRFITVLLAVVAVVGTVALIAGAAGAITLSSEVTLVILGLVVLSGLIFGDHDGAADRRRGHARGHQPAELVHRHGRGDGRASCSATPCSSSRAPSSAHRARS